MLKSPVLRNSDITGADRLLAFVGVSTVFDLLERVASRSLEFGDDSGVMYGRLKGHDWRR